MSAILFTYFEVFHLVSFLYFASLPLCKFLLSIVGKNSVKRVHEENKQTKDERLDECPEKDGVLVADVLNGGETLGFLPYEPNKSETGSENHLIIEAQGVICEADSIFCQEYCDKNVADENCRETELSQNYEEKTCSGDAENCPEKEVSDDHEQRNGVKEVEKCEEIEVREDHEERTGSKDDFEATFPREKEAERKDCVQGFEGEKDGFGGMVQFTAETTSKSSWEWRSSTNYRDSEMEDLCSSSFSSADSLFIKKYDEEMLYFDRLATQKLQETEYFRLRNPWPRSISERIVTKLRRSSDDRKVLWHNEKRLQQDLEAAYVAQICLTCEALNWSYKNLKNIKSGKGDLDAGHYGHVAEQLQQFQVLLRWFIEIEPYQYGRRPETYARMRNSRPRLLQVPEITEGNCEIESKEETKIPTAKILEMMEDSIRIFVEFLTTEKSKKCILVKTLFRRDSSPYASRIHALKKAAHEKRKELKETRANWKCFTVILRNTKAYEFEVIMALTDIKVVLRVLKMAQINQEQLHWCEEKIKKLSVQRDPD